ncbi:MAG: helicase-associated domain-containing protein [Anaerolineales bacterium]|nr:helicase-associated domain-containing protein [Anaerolineales bacterium]
MPPLARVLVDYDFNLLQTIAEQWGVSLRARSQREAAQEVETLLKDPRRLTAALPVGARAALDALLRAPGARLPLSDFARKHGEVRVMGAARRDRERPWANRPSAAEQLFYRGLIAHGFFESSSGPREHAFIAEDLAPLIPPPEPDLTPNPPGAPGDAPAGAHPAEPLLADDVATLLAYAQILPLKLAAGTLTTQLPSTLRRFLREPRAIDLEFQLALDLDLLTGTPLKPDSETARPFLERPRWGQALALADAWRASTTWNDLLRLPGLTFEGQTWANDPQATRTTLIGWLRQVPAGRWWSLDAFVAALRDRHPDFQRPAGDFDSWYIKDAANGAYLRGLAHWDRIDGALIRAIVTGPLMWLGLLEGDAKAFRVTELGAGWLRGTPPVPPRDAAVPVLTTPTGEVRVASAAPAYLRFRAARVCKWIGLERGVYIYRLTPLSLKRAGRQGVKLERILDFLRQASAPHEVPPRLTAALQRFGRHGTEAILKEAIVFRTANPELMETLRRTPAVQELLGEALGPTASEVRAQDLPRLRAALSELGLLLD